MAERVDPANYPWWVKISLLGAPSRSGQWLFVALSIAAALGCVIYAFWDRRLLVGVLFLLAALMYWLTIRWVDRHGSWPGHVEPGGSK